MYNKYIDLYISGYKAGSRDVVINLHKSANSDVYELDYLNYLDSNSPILHDANFSSETILNKQANAVELLRLGGGSLAQGGKLLGKGLIQTGTGLGKLLASSIASGYSGLSNLLRYNPAYNSIKQRQVSNLVNNNPKIIHMPKPTPLRITAPSPPKINISNNNTNMIKDVNSPIVQALKTPNSYM